MLQSGCFAEVATYGLHAIELALPVASATGFKMYLLHVCVLHVLRLQA